MSYLVSVVVPAYKREFIAETLWSIVSQSYKQLEIIVVDDGSPNFIYDEIKELVDKFGVRYYRQENKKMAAARNTGIGLSNGEFIAFCDDDDIWEPDKIEKQMATIISCDASLIYTFADSFCNKGKVDLPRACKYPSSKVFYDLLYGKMYFACSSVLIRKECIEAVGFFNESMSCYGVDDTDMWLRLCRNYKVAAVPEILTHIRRHENRVSNNRLGMLDRAISMKKRICRDFKLGYFSEAKCMSDYYYNYAYACSLRNHEESPVKFYFYSFFYSLNVWRITPIVKLLFRKK